MTSNSGRAWTLVPGISVRTVTPEMPNSRTNNFRHHEENYGPLTT
jgi:hypothetical protein